MKQIRIAHVTHSFDAGGIENGIVNIINGLDWNNYFHLICCLTKSGDFEQRIKSSNITIIELNRRLGNDLRIPLKLAKKFKKYNVDIVHLRGWGTLIEGIMGAKLACIKKIIYGFHGRTFEGIKNEKKRRNYAEKFALNFVDKILTLSSNMKTDFCHRLNIPNKKIDIIHNGVDVAKFRPGIDISNLKKEFHIEKHDFIIGSVGRLDAVKDCDTLIQGFHLFNQRNENSKLIIVGDGPELSILKEIVSRTNLLHKVVFTGYRTNIPQMLNLMDIYVQTSLYEGFSNTILEAMAVGLPVITTDVGGNSFIVFDGINGYLIDPQNPSLLHEKLMYLSENRSIMQKMGVENRKTIVENFSVQKMIKKYHALYSNLYSHSTRINQ